MTLFEHDFVAAGSIERPVGDTGRMLQMMTGYWVTQVVRTAAELRIADHLHADGATPAEVAEAESLDPEATFRFLRACASLGLAVSTDGKRFAGTPLLDTLRTDAPGSLRDLALWGGAESHWLPWGGWRTRSAPAPPRRKPLSAHPSSTGSPPPRRKPRSSPTP
ncbi:methyltransferase family protein [Streptomyces prasinopilosus]|uniref:methyltransferase family protein n=1 Tax=Streptomyces prasinopilosus TaxID=67344 RepID=UPI001F0A4C4B|nr:methyltransferase dimerization domain-containing protein [Streptomyces prasinopilosus]